MNKTTRVISTKVSLFIIPNHASLVEDLICPSTLMKQQAEISELNETDYIESKDRLVQVWIHADDAIQTENLDRHGARIIIDDEYCIITDCHCELIGEQYLRGHKEGDIIQYKVPALLYKRGANIDEKEEIVLDMQIELNQLGFRYKSFGPIEEVLKYVTR